MDFKNKNSFLTKILIYLTFFSLWVFFSYAFLFNKAQNKVLKTDFYNQNLNNSWNIELNMDKYNNIFNYIKKYYYDFDDVDIKDLEESSIIWLVSWLNDPYTEYFNIKENQDFKEALSWDFEWIWAVLEKNELWVKIMSIIPNSPAEKSDLRVSDIVMEVNWQNIANMTTQEVVSLIKWPSWKEVNLLIKRLDEIIKKQIFTWAIVIPSIKWEEIDKDIWYIAVSTFWEKTANEFRKEIEKFKNKKGIIIDLRWNWGWYLDIATDILSNFIPNWEVIAITKYKDWKEEKYFSERDYELYTWKVVILVDWNSASASEILAWAMSDYQKAILVWNKTYWKWSVQEPISLPDWSMIKITIAKWFTPKDKNIDKQWINPDIDVSIKPEDIEKLYDRQLEEAKKVLKSFIENKYLKLSIDKYKEKS